MKYANSLKIINSFPHTSSKADLSQKRTRELCERLGKVQLGTRYICLPDGGAGYACSLMLEAVLKAAGHRVGRISGESFLGCRENVFVNGNIPPIEDFNKATTELKSAVQRLGEQVYFEEASLALGLLLCKLGDCEFVILQGLSGKDFSLDAVCAPYDLIVMPTVYDGNLSPHRIKTLCEAVRRGTREVVSGNQKSEIYNQISNSCVINGIRLYIPVKAQLEITEVSARKLGFNYGGREGYTLRSPSGILRDVAITVIESALALRRGGVKLPWDSIASGIAAVSSTHCFDIISASPLVVADSAESVGELEMALKTANELWGERPVTLIVGGDKVGEIVSSLSALEKDFAKVVAVGAASGDCICAQNIKEAVDAVIPTGGADGVILCIGGIGFAQDIKAEIVKTFS